MGRGASCGVRTSRRTRSTGQPQGYRADVPLGALQTAADRRIGRSDDRRLFMVSLSNQLRRCAISAALLGGSRNAWTGKLEMIRGVTATLPSCVQLARSCKDLSSPRWSRSLHTGYPISYPRTGP